MELSLINTINIKNKLYKILIKKNTYTKELMVYDKYIINSMLCKII